MRGHAYSPPATGSGPCTACGYGPAAPQHQATLGLVRLFFRALRGDR